MLYSASMILATGAGSTDVFDTIANPIISLINSILTPAIGIVVALGTIYVVILGAKLAKAEEPQEREKAKTAIKNAVIGFLLIFVLLLALRLSYKPLVEWVTSNTPK